MGNGQSRGEKRGSGDSQPAKFTYNGPMPTIQVEPPTPSTATLNGLETLDYDAAPGPGSGAWYDPPSGPLALDAEFSGSDSVTWTLHIVKFELSQWTALFVPPRFSAALPRPEVLSVPSKLSSSHVFFTFEYDGQKIRTPSVPVASTDPTLGRTDEVTFSVPVTRLNPQHAARHYVDIACFRQNDIQRPIFVGSARMMPFQRTSEDWYLMFDMDRVSGRVRVHQTLADAPSLSEISHPNTTMPEPNAPAPDSDIIDISRQIAPVVRYTPLDAISEEGTLSPTSPTSPRDDSPPDTPKQQHIPRLPAITEEGHFSPTSSTTTPGHSGRPSPSPAPSMSLPSSYSSPIPVGYAQPQSQPQVHWQWAPNWSAYGPTPSASRPPSVYAAPRPDFASVQLQGMYGYNYAGPPPQRFYHSSALAHHDHIPARYPAPRWGPRSSIWSH